MKTLNSYHLGNGLTVCRKSNLDIYLAHIDSYRNITIYVKITNKELKELIHIARTDNRKISASQKEKVFKNKSNIMGTIECMIKIKKPIDAKLSDEDRKAIIEENKNINISYLSLIKEVLFYEHHTLRDLLNGWGGVKLIKVD